MDDGHPVLRYGVAVLAVAAALVLTALLLAIRDTPFVFPFFAAVAASAWVGGAGPGWFAVVLSSVTVKYFFISPPHRLALDARDLPLFLAFVICAALAHAVSIGRRRAERSLREARAQLEVRVEERTAELRWTNESLRRSEAYLAEGQRVSHTGSWAWNVATGENVFWSREMFRIYDFPPAPDTVPFHVARQRVHPDDGPRFDEALEGAIRDRTDFELTHRLLLPDGSVKHLQVLGHPRLGESGEPVEYLGTVMDITERTRAEEALAEAQAHLAHISQMTTMAEMAASIAHEINQPLAAVVTNGGASLRWLASDPPNLAEAREALTRIIRDGNRASEVIARIRGLVKKSPPEPTKLHITDVLSDVVSLVQPEIARRRVWLYTAVDHELPPVRADRVQLQQVLLNLIVNGIEAMQAIAEGRRDLTVRAQRHESGGVLVEVRDAGVGLDPQAKDRLFDPFFSTKPAGMGMGLSISRSIIEAHGGRLWATPNAGPGATFQFVLPPWTAT